ncbi:MAG: AraC-type DNA-binding protein [Anaerocolumna sp.]|nr:AraC-type DNA-binding protein [Anaerocolumna sp.]
MNLTDLEYICDCMANVSDIPIRLYASQQFDSAFRMHHLHPDPFLIYKDELLLRKENISYFITPYLQYLGIINHKEFTIIMGPVGQCNLNRQEEHDYAFLLGISFQEFKQLLQDMNSIPVMTLENFLYLLLLVNFYLNDERLDLSDLPLFDQIQRFYNHNVLEVSQDMDEPKGQSKTFHNSLDYEKQMLAYIKAGDTDGLSAFIMKKPHGGVGKVARHYLRQLKNIFITVVTLVSRAAIDGGLSEDEAMSLSDYYIQYCEDLFDTESISALQYHMVMEFTDRVHKTKDIAFVTPLIHEVISYIKHNLANNLDSTVIAEQIHMSRSALSTRFKKEVGINLTDFIMKERINKAKSLLKYTDKPLSEISSFLCFSSQSHFQNVFKKINGITPHEYRKSTK